MRPTPTTCTTLPEKIKFFFILLTTVSLITKKYIFSVLELVVGKHLDIREIQINTCLSIQKCINALNVERKWCLKRHMLLHTRIIGFECKECHKSFVRRSVLELKNFSASRAHPLSCTCICEWVWVCVYASVVFKNVKGTFTQRIPVHA